MILHASPLSELASNAWLSVVISYSTHPSAQMSDLWLYGLFLKISGDM